MIPNKQISDSQYMCHTIPNPNRNAKPAITTLRPLFFGSVISSYSLCLDLAGLLLGPELVALGYDWLFGEVIKRRRRGVRPFKRTAIPRVARQVSMFVTLPDTHCELQDLETNPNANKYHAEARNDK